MKILIDGYGIVGQSITRKLIQNHNFKLKDILINTYDVVDNCLFFHFIESMGLKYNYSSYNNESFYETVIEFSPDIIMSLYGRRIIPVKFLNLAKFGYF